MANANCTRRRMKSQKERAITILSGWARSRTPVELLDRGSGFRYVGIIAEGSGNISLFCFRSGAGISTTLLPCTWRKVIVRENGGVEQIHVESNEGLRYIIRSTRGNQSDKDQIRQVYEQLARWHLQDTQLFVCVFNGSHALTFAGKIVCADVKSVAVRHINYGDALVISLDDVICGLETQPNVSIEVLNVGTGQGVYFSEADAKPSSVLVYSSRTTFVH